MSTSMKHLVDRNFFLVNLKNYNSEIVEKQMQEMASNLVSAIGELLREQDKKIAELEARLSKYEISSE